MICFSARNLASEDNSKHGSGTFVGKITATSGSDGNASESHRPRWGFIIYTHL